MTDDETKKSWADHYPRWRTDRDAEQVCRALCALIEMRARALSIVGKDAARLRRALIAAGIPEAQYRELKKEPQRS
ncbi:MAG: hypothetical protein E6J74_40325 [Deltaproteobacteria bacterium]|nr:MAG: hypothetical protein E6J74_40325 [Deltaproteobacteria bacterium]